MNASDILKAKLEKQYPESLKIFQDSCKYSVENGLNFIVVPFLSREYRVLYDEFDSFSEQVKKYFADLGYTNLIIWYDEIFYTLNGYERGNIVTLFLTNADIKAYISEQEKWNTWAKKGNTVVRGDQPPRPIWEAIRYINIYKK